MRVCVCICMSMGEGAHVCVSVCLEARGQSQESSSGLLSLRSLSHWPRSPQFGQTVSHPWDYKNAPPRWLFTWDLGLKLQSSWLCARHFTHGALSTELSPPLWFCFWLQNCLVLCFTSPDERMRQAEDFFCRNIKRWKRQKKNMWGGRESLDFFVPLPSMN